MTQLNRLPIATQERWEWQYQGTCRTVDPCLFFHPDGERGQARRSRDKEAVAVCAGCPAIESCRRHALSGREPYGAWEGLTEKDRESTVHQSRFAERQSRSIEGPLTVISHGSENSDILFSPGRVTEVPR